MYEPKSWIKFTLLKMSWKYQPIADDQNKFSSKQSNTSASLKLIIYMGLFNLKFWYSSWIIKIKHNPIVFE